MIFAIQIEIKKKNHHKRSFVSLIFFYRSEIDFYEPLNDSCRLILNLDFSIIFYPNTRILPGYWYLYFFIQLNYNLKKKKRRFEIKYAKYNNFSVYNIKAHITIFFPHVLKVLKKLNTINRINNIICKICKIIEKMRGTYNTNHKM